ncbi:SPOR domain-containing protein [Salinisphaera orenii]|uniref:SPOR domain-containing protein n=1 Tax=Salinisphaera orenii YIM 95161 TaxID=1051139 RepID=A0A423PNA5_9GAMM|nr:SPOR domain-containing protein [Salinisphaera halophila]ROO27001.1 hypothetical protein SAHL_11945 [Salinisphaera halophila YIM 95161]
MARDYSSRRNGNSSAKGKRQSGGRTPAARPARAKSAPGSGPPGWVWLVCGLCIGLVIAAGFYVFARPAGSNAPQSVEIAAPQDEDAATNTDDAPEETAAAEPDQNAESEPRFSFYKMLPNYEVVIPEEEYPEEEPDTAASAAQDTPAGEPPPPPDSTQPTTPRVEEPGNYVIQAGSFSRDADADRRKAELALLGVPANVVSVDLSSGKTVYRVQSNTIRSSDKLNELLKRLRENRIDTLVMRAKN